MTWLTNRLKEPSSFASLSGIMGSFTLFSAGNWETGIGVILTALAGFFMPEKTDKRA